MGTNGNAFSARTERNHEILNGFKDTHLIAGAEHRVPVMPVDRPILSVVPGFAAYPPELAYPDPARTYEPAVIATERGKSRLVYSPGDIERTMGARAIPISAGCCEIRSDGLQARMRPSLSTGRG